MYLVNSPIVRGDNLRFREEGVKDVISRVLLPWLNSFRFFLGHVAILKKATGIDFKYDPHAPLPNNVMDRWVLARCQSLILLVRQEMAAYRLYTIIPRLLDLIDELTNWYIRFNRKRFKGEDGKQDTVSALNTLFETLFTLCLTMVRALSTFWITNSCTTCDIVLLHSLLHGEHLPDSASVYSGRPKGKRYPIGALPSLPGSEGRVL